MTGQEIVYMADKKLTLKELEALQAQIEYDQAQPIKPAEKRVKINTTFNNALKIMSRTPPPKKSKK
jgi:hypothetical protein